MRQARKEVWDTPLGDQRGLFIGPVEDLLTDFSRIDLDIPRHEILHRMEELYEEFSHYCAFANAYDALLGPGEAKITPMRLKDVPDWAENAALRERRAAIRVEHGAIGERACFFTEGGYCTLFSEGMKLAGNGGADELIARACALVYEDEFGHMCKGIVGLDDGALSGDDWELLTTLSVELAALRLPMRNAQFSYPLGDDRLGMIRSGCLVAATARYYRSAHAQGGSHDLCRQSQFDRRTGNGVSAQPRRWQHRPATAGWR
jgi:hypothetical protein